MTTDLHCHSTFSDGTLTPEQLVDRAAHRGVRVLALTDHDDTGGLTAAQAAAASYGLKLVKGVEISVTWRGHTIHVVGLGIDPTNRALDAGLAATRAGRGSRAEKIVAAFDALGIPGSLGGARRFASNPQLIGRAHFARFLVERGTVKDVKTAFRRFLGAGQPCYVPHQWATLRDAVGWIRGAGGAAVVAHPGRYPLDSSELRALFTEFRDLGGVALEVASGSHNAHQLAAFAKHARYFGLAASSGSDFHGPGESYHDVGSLPALPSGSAPVWEVMGF